MEKEKFYSYGKVHLGTKIRQNPGLLLLEYTIELKCKRDSVITCRPLIINKGRLLLKTFQEPGVLCPKEQSTIPIFLH